MFFFFFVFFKIFIIFIYIFFYNLFNKSKIINTCYINKTNKKYLVDFAKKFYSENFIDNSHILNLCFRAFGHRYIVDYSYMKNLSKKVGYTSCSQVTVDKLPDKLIKEYLKKYKSSRWFSETSIFILKK